MKHGSKETLGTLVYVWGWLIRQNHAGQNMGVFWGSA